MDEPTEPHQDTSNDSPVSAQPQNIMMLRIGLFVLLGISAALAVLVYRMDTRIRELEEGGRIVEQELPMPTAEPTERPSISTPTSASTSFPSQPTTLTPTPSTMKLRSSVCPVEFTVPAGRIYIQSKQQYGLWQLRESDERFMYLPRAEEVNGKKVHVQLRAEGQVYGDGEAYITVQCQDNPNTWDQDTFFSYVLKADFLKDPFLTKTSKWNREVRILTYSYTSSSPSTTTVWMFATQSKLFHISYTAPNSAFKQDALTIFDTIRFTN